jgi:amino acid adenylation domain-containing protein
MKHSSVQEMVSAVAAEFGPQVAIEHGGHTLTYAELEAESNRLANFLLKNGLSKSAIVGLFTDNPAEVITGILGVLKAGGVFVPLDPTFPERRLEMLSNQVHPEWFVSTRKHLAKLGHLQRDSSSPAKVICLDQKDHTAGITQNNFELLASYRDFNVTTHPSVAADPDAPCSIYFTSGSTGRPKAILGRLKGIAHFMMWEIEAVGAGPGTRVTQLASPSFDGFLKDAFVPLCSGGAICAPESRDLILDASSLADWLDVQQIEVLHCVPSVFRALTNVKLQSNYFETMRSIVLTGEPLYPADVKRWFDIFGTRIKIFNIYGTTETSLSKFAHEVQPEDVERASIPVGPPIKGAAVMIVNSRGQLCREEAVGEIYIRTPYRSHGYYQAPELTNEVFIQNPFSDDPKDIVHKTGDFGRLLKGGELEILGRRDQQVKVRGVRVELGEIENLLRGHEAVADVAVMDRDDADGNKFLAVYVTMINGTGTEALREYLAERLPETMLPSLFIKLDQLPRTLNGKIDRKTLLSLELDANAGWDSERTTLTPVEEIVAGIFREVLRVPSAGRQSNFFNLGGHSLLAVQVILRVREALQVELPVRSIFEAPTVEQLSLLIQEQINEGRQHALTPIPCVPRDGELPLSFTQRRMWFVEQISHGTTTFHIPFKFTLKGALNVAALEQTFSEIIRRHEILRTVFPDVLGEPVQVILPPTHVSIPLADLSGFGSEREVIAEQLAAAEHARLFSLDTGPLARLLLIRLSAHEHMLAGTLHHIISDGWSKGILIREISALYKAFDEGQPSPLPELPIQYADFGAWQRGSLTGDSLEQELDYWKQKLAGAPAVLELKTDRPRPPVPTYRGSVVPIRLSRQNSDDLKKLGQRKGVTLFMTLLAGFQTLLHRYTAQNEIVVGTTVANRDRFEVENLIGCFVNLLALRTDCSGDPTFEELLDTVRETTLKAYAHQSLPFEKLIEELQPARRQGYAPLVQVLCQFQNQPTLTELTLPNLTLSFPALSFNTSEWDLILDMSESAAGLAGTLFYNTDLFDEATIARMGQQLCNLLESVAANPSQRLSSASLVGESERKQLLEEWGHTEAAYTADACIHELFAQQAARTPDRIAIVFGDQQLTYAEVNERADMLARRLRSFGVAPDTRIGIYLPRSTGMVVGMLGVLKSGASYVPLDPSYPFDRIAFMLDDSAIPLLVTERALLDELPAGDAMPVCLDDEEEWTESDEPPVLHATVSSAAVDNLAYVIYTSGSTGKPKGVMVEHRAAVNLAFAHQQAIYHDHHCASGLRVSLNAPFAFDGCVERLLLLLFGHTVYVIPEEVRQDPDAMLTYIKRHGLDVLDFTPSQLRLLIEAGLMEKPRMPARLVLVGGEPIDEPLWLSLAQQDRVDFFNVYGPTECTVNASVCRIRNSPHQPAIGRPLANVDIYLMDQRQQLVPAGIAGEIRVGGAGLARGYLNRPDLTAEKFAPHPFGTTPGQRIYFTGDRARFLSDGQIEFLGRADGQVKIRGFRVELGEIEAALLDHHEVSEAAVVARDDDAGRKRLVAYVATTSGSTPNEIDLDALRRRLAQKLSRQLSQSLPAYMVPSSITLLDALPRDVNGKLDRKALPEPQARPATNSREPRTPQEEILCSLFAEVLGLDHVGIDDNFFELGGHSLLAVRLISMARSALGVELDIIALFEAPSPSLLGLRLNAAEPARLPSSRERSAGQLPLSYAQQRLWFIQQLAPDSHAYNIPLALHITGPLDLDALNATVSEVVRRHEVLRTTFAFDNGQPYQVIHPPTRLELPVTDLTQFPAAMRMDEVQRLAENDARLPFDLEHTPPLRAQLLRLDPQAHVLLLTMHHIASDGWSVDVLIKEVGVLYPAFSSGAESPLPELPIQYADYALWERDRVQNEELDQQLAYWREQLAGAPPVLELPADRPRPPTQSFRGAQHSFDLSPDLTRRLKQLSRREGVTLFMTLLAGFNALLHRYTRANDIVVGSPFAGRNAAGTEGLIGFFVNTLVLRTNLAGDPTFRELLARVRAAALGAFAHQDLPFEKLVEETQPERHTTHSPLYQVMFELQNASLGKLQLPGLELKPLKLDMAAAKFDLTLSMDETDDGIAAFFNCSTDIFAAETIQRMAQHLVTLLDDVSAHADRHVSELELLSTDERHQLIGEWNDTTRVYPQDQLIHELVELQVQRQPEAVAIVFEDEAITYQELNRRAERTASQLRRVGIGPETLVGVALDRSIEMVVALLGVLKAGGAFVAFDLAYPKKRLALMFEATRAPLLLTREPLLDNLPAFDGEVFFPEVGGGFARPNHRDTEHTEIEQAHTAKGSDSLAYVFFTSGSTGEPKGVLAQHSGVVNYLTFNAETYQLGPTDTVLQLASPSFDASVRDTLGPLIAGARLVLVNDAATRDPDALLAQMSNYGVTCLLSVVPSLLSVLTAAARRMANPPARVRLILTSGESLPLAECAKARTAFGQGITIVNQYGPTECTMTQTFYSVPHAHEATGAALAGRPIANMQLYILDQRLNLVPAGITGDVYIGGVGLARGYLNHATQTAEKFIPHPFSPEPGARLYKTGDLARFHHDGQIELLGRADNQIKLRGLRIEPAEIEATLLSHDDVREAAVVAREDAGEKRLVGYVVGADQSAVPTATELREHLRRSLPEYLVPSVFVALDSLPLTPNGKVDRSALPPPQLNENGAAYVAPRTDTERALAAVWQAVLATSHAGLDDNFFDVGGHSLLATQLLWQIKEAFDVELPMRTLFERPTIAGLAESIETILWAARDHVFIAHDAAEIYEEGEI